MANFGAGYGAGYGAGAPFGGNAFGGFEGGYNQAPGGIVPTGFVNPMGAGIVPTMGTNLPSVDPNNYGGTVHFGPSVTTGYNAQFPGGLGGGFSAYPGTF